MAGQREQRDGVDYNYGTGENEGWEINDYYLEGQLEGDIGDRFTWWFKVRDRLRQGRPSGRRTATLLDRALPAARSTPSAATAANPAFAYTNPSVISYTQTGTRTRQPVRDQWRARLQLELRRRRRSSTSMTKHILEAVYSTDWFDIKYVGGYTFYDYKL